MHHFQTYQPAADLGDQQRQDRTHQAQNKIFEGKHFYHEITPCAQNFIVNRLLNSGVTGGQDRTENYEYAGYYAEAGKESDDQRKLFDNPAEKGQQFGRVYNADVRKFFNDVGLQA